MDQIEIASIQRSTSRIGLGCGRLVGGVSARSSRAIIEAALEAGITHFDVAPSYGLGLAEDVVGDVLHGNPGVTIATKFGIARPRGGGGMAIARKFLRSAERESWPALLLTAVMAMQPDALILISSNDPARLTSSVSLIDWNAANNWRNGFLEAFTELRAAQQNVSCERTN